ncbi:hypothetical protein BGX38DRAFT_1268878 [Terfezia claveryi]|nr:hypothetical protein BGX38DRAFT_1268878 [Terfezia claveryi]
MFLALSKHCTTLLPEYLLSSVTDPGELNKWKTAAENWRLPYWDSALRRSNNHVDGMDNCCLPDIALNEILESSNDPNPWYAYDFPGGQSGIPDLSDYFPISIQTRTVRYAPAYDPESSENLMTSNFSYGGFTDGAETSGDSAKKNLNLVHESVHPNNGGYR